MLDQWGKPLFTIPAIPFALFGIKGLYVFNILCTLAGGWLCYLTARRLGTRLPWMAAVFFLFQPVVFGNVISALTEPINAFFLALICYSFASQKVARASVLASFLPFFRSEGFILVFAVGIYLLARKKFRFIPFLLIGPAIYTIVLGISTGDWLALIHQNPYVNHELHGKFDPGHGNFLHYTQAYKEIWGLVTGLLLALSFLVLAGHAVYLLRRRTPEERSRFAFWLLAPIFLSFFLAHSYIWYRGMMGSHGLLRVFVVVAPAAALLAQYAFDRIMSYDVRVLNRTLPLLLSLLCIYLAYKGNHFRMPFHKEASIPGYPAIDNIHKALAYVEHTPNLRKHTVVHQLPFVNAEQGWDPWESPDKTKTFYLWSLDKTPGKDWFPDSTVVIWDGWHAVRDAPMPLQTMQSLKEYHEIARFRHQLDTTFDVRVFLKVKQAGSKAN